MHKYIDCLISISDRKHDILGNNFQNKLCQDFLFYEFFHFYGLYNIVDCIEYFYIRKRKKFILVKIGVINMTSISKNQKTFYFKRNRRGESSILIC